MHLKSSVVSIKLEGGRKRVRLNDHTEHVVDEVMFAVGRRPNVEGLGLDACGVALDDKGAVKVDAFSRSSCENIYAVGDVTNRVNFDTDCHGKARRLPRPYSTETPTRCRSWRYSHGSVRYARNRRCGV